MARATRGYYIYNGDNHGANAEDYSFAMSIPVAEAGEAGRGWVAATGGEDFMPRRLEPRHVVGRDVDGNTARAIVASTGATMWTGAVATFTVNGVSYSITGYVGEKRTITRV